MCTVLHEMEYKIKLNNKVTKGYSNSDQDLFGTGQGAGWSPPCWAANSDVISYTMEKYTPGLMLVHPNGEILSNTHLVAFVDDTSLGTCAEAMLRFHPQTTWPVQKQNDIHSQLTANMQFYGGVLESTGGALAWEKCTAYILLFE